LSAANDHKKGEEDFSEGAHTDKSKGGEAAPLSKPAENFQGGNGHLGGKGCDVWGNDAQMQKGKKETIPQDRARRRSHDYAVECPKEVAATKKD